MLSGKLLLLFQDLGWLSLSVHFPDAALCVPAAPRSLALQVSLACALNFEKQVVGFGY